MHMPSPKRALDGVRSIAFGTWSAIRPHHALAAALVGLLALGATTTAAAVALVILAALAALVAALTPLAAALATLAVAVSLYRSLRRPTPPAVPKPAAPDA
jgi:hypothetical protein